MGRESARTLTGLLTGLVFVCILALPTLDSIFGIDGTPPPVERRPLAAPPGLPRSFRDLEAQPAGFDAYLNDHFGFRSFLVRLEARATVLWLGVPPSPNVELMVGRDGWLFFAGDRSVSYIEGTEPFSETELQAWRAALRQRHDWLARRGIRYLVVFAPGSPSVYPEHLPGWVRPSARGTRLDQLLGAMRSCPEVSLLDLRRALVRVKRLAPLYSRTDTHWNYLGAFAAYREITRSLTRWFPSAHPPLFSDFDLRWVESPGGDLAAMAGIKGLVTEQIPWLIPKQGLQHRNVRDLHYETLRPWRHLEEPVITERPGAAIHRAVILRDSFFVGLVPFLSEHLGRAVYLFTPEIDPSIIERERPDLVIQEYTERLLSVITPTNPPELTNGASVQPGSG